jgi:predicted nucleotidyltransferase
VREVSHMTTPTTIYPDVNDVIALLLVQIQQILGARLVGCYLYGSLVTGDFDPADSDIDLVAVLASEPDEDDCAALLAMHRDFAEQHERWDDRIEVAYLSWHALRTYRTQTSAIAVISPGEPFHMKDAGSGWLLNWYVVRERGVALAGPLPQTLNAPISHGEFLVAVYRQAHEWRGWVRRSALRKPQSYAILTICRALFSLTTGAYGSKDQAAIWAARRYGRRGNGRSGPR